MPLYDFSCPRCQGSFESLTTPWEPIICPHCNGNECVKLPSAPKTIGLSAESKETARREGKRERVSKIYEKQGIKL